MNAPVVYESMFGNTRAVVEAVAEGPATRPPVGDPTRVDGRVVARALRG